MKNRYPRPNYILYIDSHVSIGSFAAMLAPLPLKVYVLINSFIYEYVWFYEYL